MGRFDDKAAEALIRRQKEWSKVDQQQLDDAVKAMFQHPATRRYLYWLLDIGKAIGENPFTSDALTTAFQCGEQNIGMKVMAHLIEVEPDGFLKLLKETRDERARREGELGRLRDSADSSGIRPGVTAADFDND
jgi:hypothetical protein